MARALATLILTALLLMAVTFLSGWAAHLGWLRVPQHVLWGLLTAILILFAHTATMFYLIGRGKYIRDVAQELSLRGDFPRRTRLFKKMFFPWATYSILLTIGVTTTGGVSTLRGSGHWLHGGLAVLTVSLNFFALWRGLVVIARDLELGREMDSAAASGHPTPSGG